MNDLCTLLGTKDIAKIADEYYIKQKIRQELQSISRGFVTFKELKCIIFLNCNKNSMVESIIDDLNIFMLANYLTDAMRINIFGVANKDSLKVKLIIGNEVLYVGLVLCSNEQKRENNTILRS